MKHLLNNLSEEEKNSIRGQHTGGMQVNNSRFNTLLENKLGNSKPLVEQFDDEDDYELEDENEPYIDLTDEEDDDIHLIHRNMSSDDEELDEDTSWMNELEEGYEHDYTASGLDSMGDAAHSALKSKGYSHRGKDDEGEFYIVFDGEKFYQDDFEIAHHNDMGKIPRVEDGKLIIANPAWGA